MRKYFSPFFLIVFVSALVIFTSCTKQDTSNLPVSPSSQENVTFGENQYILVLSEKAFSGIQSAEGIRYALVNLLKTHNISESNIVAVWERALKGGCINLTPTEAGLLAKDANVSYVVKDKIVKLNDGVPEYSYYNSKSYQIQTQTPSWGIDAVGGFVNGANLTRSAWIIDTGIEFNHPDLNVNTSRSRTFIPYGRDSRTANDYHGHGTHCAGIIAAKNNNIGSVGVAAGARVIAVKVMTDGGWGYWSWCISGLNYVAMNAGRGDVANISLGGDGYTPVDEAVYNTSAYLKIAVAAGNESADANNYSPARANGPNIYTVSAYDINHNFAWFSNYGNPPVDYSAPGVSIYSTMIGNSYASWSGTSMAAPFVAGILLANNGVIYTNSSVTVSGDPDGTPDPVASRVP